MKIDRNSAKYVGVMNSHALQAANQENIQVLAD